MSDEAGAPLTPRLRRLLELVYGVEGVVAARVWQWPGRIAIGVGVTGAGPPQSILAAVESAVDGLRDAAEIWEFGILQDAPTTTDSRAASPHARASEGSD